MKKRIHDTDGNDQRNAKKARVNFPLDQIISETYLGTASIELKNAYASGTPFKHVGLDDFTNEVFLAELIKALQGEVWFPKNNDLYTFEQTDDLRVSEFNPIKDFCKAIYSAEFRGFLESITDIKLDERVDISSHVYRKGSTLLCHDDELEGRRIAFILYLVPPDWAEEDGGTLDLFTTDAEFNARDIAKRILPKRNSLFFFETTPATWHQVAEVLSDKLRHSVSGWFHGENIVRPPHPKDQLLPTEPIALSQTEDIDLAEWINPKYFEETPTEHIRQHFEDHSCIGLEDFLLNQVEEALAAANWSKIGPAQRRNYFTLGRWGEESEKGVLRDFRTLLKSSSFVKFVSKLTSLDLQAIVRGEFRKWDKQCYTLVQDCEDQASSCGLDILFGVQNDAEWTSEHGGFTTYLDEEAELLTLTPLKNTLALVYRDKHCMRFVKFVTSSAPVPRYDFNITYIPVEGSESDEEFKSGDEEDGFDAEIDGEGEDSK